MAGTKVVDDEVLYETAGYPGKMIFQDAQTEWVWEAGQRRDARAPEVEVSPTTPGGPR